MALVLKDAAKKHLRARIAMLAPTGGGKTFTALLWAFAMKEMGMARKVGVIDTEHGSASKYINDPFPVFRVIEMEDDFSPEQYIEAMGLMMDDGVDALVIDSLSHAWAGKGGSLEIKDKVGKQKGFNDYTAWAPVSAMQNRLIETMLSYPGHLIATMRLKMEHVLEEDPISKKKVVRKIGLQPVQREGLEYEFDLVGDLDQEHRFTVSKTRCRSLDGYTATKPGAEVIRKMKAWLESGEAAKKPAPAQPAAPASEETPATAPVSATTASSQTSETVQPEPAAVAVQASGTAAVKPAAAYLKMIEDATSEAQLNAIGSGISAAKKTGRISDEERLGLVAAFKVKLATFAPKAA